MKHNLYVASLLVLILALAPGCGPDDPPPPAPEPDTAGDVESDADVPVVPPDIDPGDTEPDDGGPVEVASVSYYFLVEGGTKGQGEASVTLFPEDEPSKYAGDESFDVDVLVQTTGVTDGDDVFLYVNGVKKREGKVFSGVDFTFEEISLEGSTDDGYDVYVELHSHGDVIIDTKTVVVSTDTCDVTLSPAGDDCLVNDDSTVAPGFNPRFVVTHAGGKCTQARVTVDLGGVLIDAGFKDLDDQGQAEFFITLVAEGGTPLDGVDITVTGEVSHPTSTGLNASTSGTYTVDNSPPALAFILPDLNLTPELDLSTDKTDPDTGAKDPTDGIQADVQISVTGLSETDVGSVVLMIDGTPVGDPATPTSGQVLFSDVSFVGQQGNTTLSVQGTDSCGNLSTQTLDIPVYTVEPVVSITTPGDNATLQAADDINKSTGTLYETIFYISATGVVPDLTTMKVECQLSENTWLDVGQIAPTEVAVGDSYPVNVALDTLTLGNTTACRLALSQPNSILSQPINLTIGLPAPTLLLVSPADGAKLSSWTVAISGQGSNLEGEFITARLLASDLSEACTATATDPITDGTFTTTVDFLAACPTLQDGAYTLAVDGEDQYGNSAASLVADVGLITATVSFDTLAPAITIDSPPDGTSFDPANDPTQVDLDPSTLVYEIVVSATMANETSATGAQLCLETGAFNVCQDVDGATYGVTWPLVPLNAGQNVLVVTGSDGHANTADAKSVTVTYVSDGPLITLVAPTIPAGTSTYYSAIDTVDVIVNVATQDGDPVLGATVALETSAPTAGTASVTDPTDNGDGTYSFAAVSLPADEAVVISGTAQAPGLAPGAALLFTAFHKTTVPTVVLTDLSGTQVGGAGIQTGDYINLASVAICLGSDPDCITNVVASTQNTEAGATVELAVDCAGSGSTYTETVSEQDGSVTFANVVLLHGGTCSLTPTATDLAGVAGAGAALVVNVDRKAPGLTWDSPAGTQLIDVNDLKSVEEGLQHALTVVVSGIEQNQIVNVQLDYVQTDTNGSKQYAHIVTEDVADNGTYDASFGDPATPNYITYPEGTVTLTAVATDAAGNAAAPAIKIILVEADAPTALITFPTAPSQSACGVGTPCPAGQVCNQSQCWVGWSGTDSPGISTVVDGFVTSSDNLRVCSDHADLQGVNAACDSDGYSQLVLTSVVAGDYPFVAIVNLPQGYQTIIAELKATSDGGWTSSLDEDDADVQFRRVYYDSTNPAVADQDGQPASPASGASKALWSPSDSTIPFSVLNIAEQKNGQPVLYRVTVDATEAGTVNLFVNSLERLSDGAVTAGANEFEMTLDEGNNAIYGVLTDSVGNKSPANPTAGAELLSVLVDTQVPTVSFTYPAKTPLTLADFAVDGDTVRLAVDPDGSTVTLQDFGIQVSTGIVGGDPDGAGALPADAAGTISFPGALKTCISGGAPAACEAGNHQYTAIVASPNANSNQASTNPAVIAVDFEAPAGAITTPVAGQVFGDAAGALVDASPLTPGFQVDVDFTTDVGALTWELYTVDCGADATYTTCEAEVFAQGGSVTAGSGAAEPTVPLTIPISTASSFKQLRLRTYDAVGNTADVDVNLSFEIGSCVVAFTNLPESTFFNGSICPNGISCSEATIVLDAKFFGPCGGVNDLDLIVNGADSAELVGSIDFANQIASFNVTVADGATANLELQALNTNATGNVAGCGSACVASSGQQPRIVDLQLPVVTLDDSAAAVTSLGSTSILGDALNLPSGGITLVYNARDDTGLDASLPGFQHHGAVQMDDANADGGRIVSISSVLTPVTGGATTSDLAPANISLPFALSTPDLGGSPGTTATQNLQNITYGEGSNAVTITVEDAAGNQNTVTYVATVDTVAPNAIVLGHDGSNVLLDADVSGRMPSVTLTWTAVGDNGDGAADTLAATSYHIRFSLAAIDTSAKFDAACPASSLAHTASLPTPAAPASAETFTVTGPDPRAEGSVEGGQVCKFAPLTDGGSWHFAVRATDAAGNQSDVSAAQSVSTTGIAMNLSRVTVNAIGSPFITFNTTSIGDVNGDGIDDLALHHLAANGFCVLYGHDFAPTETLDGLSGDNHECVTGVDTVLSELGLTGSKLGFHARGLGDVNGDGLADFGVTGLTGASGAEGFAVVYLGVQDTGPDLSNPNIILRGAAAGSKPAMACSAGNFNGDSNPVNGNPIHDIGFGSPEDDTFVVLSGNTSWTSGGTQDLVIDISSAADITAHALYRVTAVYSGTQLRLGEKCGRAGDILPTPGGGPATDDVLAADVTSSGDVRLFLIPGRTEVNTSATITDHSGVLSAEDALVVRLGQDAPGITGGFASEFYGDIDVTGDGVPDVVAKHSSRSSSYSDQDGRSVYIFDGAALPATAGQEVVQINGSTAVGNALIGTVGYVLIADVYVAVPIGNFDGWTHNGADTVDLLTTKVAGGSAPGSGGEIRFNHAQNGGSEVLGLFPYVDLTLENANATGVLSFGTQVARGPIDVTGDGLPDIVVGTGKGDVLIYR